MLRLPLDSLQPGMICARNIYNANNNLLLSAETVLTEILIVRLQTLGIQAVFIKTPPFDIDNPPEILQEQTKLKALNVIQKTFRNFQQTKKVDLSEIGDVANSIIQEIINNRNLLIHLNDIRTYDDDTFAHSLNVCLLSVLTGLKMNYTALQLKELAFGALLHDIGKMLIPLEILNKPSKLTPEEFNIVKQHVNDGFELLRRNQNVPLLSSHVAFQHHENYDGNGYTRGLRDNEIHEYAKIVAAADVFEAISADRPYRPALLPHDACDIILASAGSRLDPDIVNVMMENIAVYPIGTLVMLTTKEIGIVIDIIPKLQSRPIVRILSAPPRNDFASPSKIIDLSQKPTIFIAKALSPKEALELSQSMRSRSAFN